jgi:hypothetical protein
MDGSLFREEQALRSTKFMWIIFAALLFTNVGLIHYTVQQLTSDSSAEEMSDEVMLLVMIPIILLMLVLLWVLWVSRLVTDVRDDGIYIQYRPFHRHMLVYKWTDVADMQTRQYKPLREFGGWGLRLSPFGGGTAYNVSGDQGLQLVLKDGKRILIGTQRRAELDAALERINLD